jgi:hypothetical protein
MSRAEQIEALKGGIGLYGKERDIAAAAELEKQKDARDLAVAKAQRDVAKPTDLTNFVNDYVAERTKAGDKRPTEALRVEGYQKYPGYEVRRQVAGMQADTAGGAQALTGSGQDITAQTAALNAWGRLMDSRTPEKKEFQSRQRQDKANAEKGTPTTLAEDYKKKWFETNTPGAKPASAAPKVAAPVAGPSALPAGARQIGTSGGKPVYQTPDGKQFIQN